ncbi:MAG: hypothetical protein QX196_07000 [Methylococcaceae bacterium]
MKLQFNAELDYQWDAISAIADIFKGQDSLQTNFSVSKTVKKSMGSDSIDFLNQCKSIINQK